MVFPPAMFTDLEFKNAKSKDPLPCKCQQCGKTFYSQKHNIQSYIKRLKNNPKTKYGFYCCSKCATKSMTLKQLVPCNQCGKQIYKALSEIQKHNFCNRSCSAIYNNTHKNNGCYRSSIEHYVEEYLLQNYNDLTIIFNDRLLCNGYELDIYIPKLHLAIELNGIIHYKPIYGLKKLKHTQYKDYCKKLYCQMNNVKLMVIDISNINHFTDEYKTKVLNLVFSIINTKKNKIECSSNV